MPTWVTTQKGCSDQHLYNVGHRWLVFRGTPFLNVLGKGDTKSVGEMYNLYMSELAVSEARNHLAEAIELARSGEPVYVTRRGHRVAVLVDAASYDALVESAEDAVDRAELEAARLENDYVPWEEVKADLGLR